MTPILLALGLILATGSVVYIASEVIAAGGICQMASSGESLVLAAMCLAFGVTLFVWAATELGAKWAARLAIAIGDTNDCGTEHWRSSSLRTRLSARLGQNNFSSGRSAFFGEMIWLLLPVPTVGLILLYRAWCF